jgi:tetratricopeptide (TPR) repeat protein
MNQKTELQQAIDLHKLGRLSEAKVIYEKLLMSDPNNVILLSNLGAIKFQDKKFDEAIRFLDKSLEINTNQPFAYNTRGNVYKSLVSPNDALVNYNKAIRLKPDYAEAHNNRGAVLMDLKLVDDAIASYDKAIELNPNYAEPYNNRGTALRIVNRFEDALKNYDKAIQLKPNNAEVYNGRGIVLRNLNRLDEAIASYDKAIELNPNYAEVFNNRAIIFWYLKRPEDALKNYDKAIQLNPEYAGALNNRGLVLKGLNRIEDALASYDKAIQLNPEYAGAFNNRGIALKNANRFEDALASYDKAIQLNPEYAEAFNNRGLVLKDLNRFEDALASYDKAIQLNPEYAEAYNNIAIVLKDLNRLEEALASYDKAIQLNPEYAEAYNNRGTVFREMRCFEDELKCYNKAIELKPDYAGAYWNKSLLRILAGEYKEGWELYEWRRRMDSLKEYYPNHPQPLWLGNDSLAGKKILIQSEQGLGDTLQFCRYLLMLKELKPERIIFEVNRPLVFMMVTLGIGMDIIQKKSPLPSFDYYCPLLSLPHAFKTSLDTIPAQTPYLSADTDKSAYWSKKLGQKKKFRIGLAWSGSPSHHNDHNRSLSFSQLKSLFSLPFEFHSLQKEIRKEDKKNLNKHKNVIQHQDDLKDFTDTAALADQMDLIISVDTSVAHLAGALGKKLWILLPYMPDYRWMLDREDTPWYPSARLFRQPKNADWESVIKNLNTELKKLI